MAILNGFHAKRIYLDANIFIYLHERLDEYAELLDALTEKFDSGKSQALTSELSLLEILVKPIKDKREDLQQIYKSAFSSEGSLTVCAINRPVLVKAAEIRADGNLKLPDAIHASTAIIEQCDAFLSRDQDYKKVPGLNFISLDSLR